MNKKFHFISGLPRAGTTLLSAILNQNPKFQASISGPLARFTRAVIQESSSQGGYRHQCPPEKRKKIISGIFDNYYDDPTKEVFFDTNRGWGLLFPTIKDLYPDTKILMCVRDIYKILDSFEVLQRKQPYTFTSMFSSEEGINVYTRCQSLLSPSRTLGFAYNSLKEAISGEFKTSIFIIEYENLARNPYQMMQNIYKFLGEDYFEHDFNDVETSYELFDEDVQIEGLHTTRKKVEYIDRRPIIPPDIIESVRGMEVWR